MKKAIPIAISILLLAACSDGISQSDATSMPTPVVSASEIQRLSAEADAFAGRSLGAWPDVDAYFADMAEDVVGADPSARDSVGGKQAWLRMMVMWERLTDYTIEVTGTFISTDGAAYKELYRGLWPTDVGRTVEGERDPDGMYYFETFAFEDGLVVEGDLWWYPKDNERVGFGCFAVDGCPALQETVDRYVSAWTARDSDAIAALYSDEGSFVDSLLGLEASGPESVGALADKRFGSTGELTVEVLDLFSWTDGYGQPSERDPHHGSLLGVTIHYRATVNDNGARYVQEAVTTLELGHRYVSDDLYTHVDIDPDGLIHRETIYHEPTSLLVAAEGGA